MARHRNIKMELDDYYDELFDEQFDDDYEDEFEAQYLSGTVLNIKNNNTTLNISQPAPADLDQQHEKTTLPTLQTTKTTYSSPSSNLTKLAIQHLDKHQWQLPLLDMDKKFRDRTYYKHYTDSYITSLRSKLGHFLADKQLISNPMKYHLQEELDNYSKYSRMSELLTEYYQSLGCAFFSFATPSPDEEIVIGCRLGTKGCYRH